MGFLGGSVVSNLPANAGDVKEEGSIPGKGGNPGVRNGNPLQVAWNVPWTEEPGGLQSMGLPRIGHDYYCIKVVILEEFSLT